MRKLPKPKQRPDGQYQVRWRFKANGREHRPARLFATESDANDWILRNLVDESRLSPADRKRTFAAIAERWLDGKRRKGLRPASLSAYGYAANLASDHFGPQAVSDISPMDVEDFAAALADKGYAPKTLSLIWMVFRATLRHAVRLRAAPFDPAYGVDPPATTTDRPARYHFLRPVEVSNLAQALADRTPPYALLVRFAAYTGLRRGELVGLDLRHITLTPPTPAHPAWGGSVRVEVNLKTKNAKRTVPLPGWLAEEMHRYIAAHPHQTNPTAALWPASSKAGINWVKRIHPVSFYSGPFKTAARRAGLPDNLRIHDLRHTYASLLAADGVRVEVVAKLMGHADATVTRQTYTHLWPEHLDDAVAALAAPPAPTPTTGNVRPLRRAQ